MLQTVVITSLKILAIWVCFQDGMILGPVRRMLERILPTILRKPLFECLTCMGGVWTVFFWWIGGQEIPLIELLPAVIGLNYLIAVWKDQFNLPYDH